MNNAAQTIATQLGNRALSMMGAKNLLADDTSLSFKIGRNAKSITHVTISLTPADEYRVKFQRVRNLRVTDLAEVECQVSELHETIENHTGLYLSL